MGRTRFEAAPCPIARTTDLLGDDASPGEPVSYRHLTLPTILLV